MTWVYRKSENGDIKWRILPIHAAIVFKAPKIVIETLLVEFPQGARLRDDRGNLPLHLVFKHGLSEEIIATLVDAYPQAVSQLNSRKKTPLECAPNRRGMTVFIESVERKMRTAMKEQADLEEKNNALTTELKKEIDRLKQEHETSSAELKKEIEDLNEKNEALATELTLKTTILETESEVKEKKDIEAMEKVLESTRNDFIDLKIQHEKLAIEKDEYLQKIKELEKQLEESAKEDTLGNDTRDTVDTKDTKNPVELHRETEENDL
eukprot:2854184-Ditylum_brightwellii.AAC.1